MRREVLIDNKETGWLLGFGVDYRYGDNNQIFPVDMAIVERTDGSIFHCQTHRIRFTDYCRAIKHSVFYNHFNRVKIISSYSMSNHLKGIELLDDGQYIAVKEDIYYALIVVFKENITKKFDKLGDAMLWVCSLKTI